MQFSCLASNTCIHVGTRFDSFVHFQIKYFKFLEILSFAYCLVYSEFGAYLSMVKMFLFCFYPWLIILNVQISSGRGVIIFSMAFHVFRIYSKKYVLYLGKF